MNTPCHRIAEPNPNAQSTLRVIVKGTRLVPFDRAIHQPIDILTLDSPSNRALAARLPAPRKGRPPIALHDLPRALLARAYRRSIPRVTFQISSYMGLRQHSSTLRITFVCAHNPLHLPAKEGPAATTIYRFTLRVSSIISTCPFRPFCLLFPAHTRSNLAHRRTCSSGTHSVYQNTTGSETGG